MEMAQAFMCICPIGNPSAQMRHTTLAPVPGCGFPKAPPFLRSKCAGRTTMARQQSARCKQNALIISPVAPWSCGTWICSARMSLRSIGPVILITRRSIGVAIWPKRNPLPQGGRCPSMIFLRKSKPVAQAPCHDSLRLVLALPGHSAQTILIHAWRVTPARWHSIICRNRSNGKSTFTHCLATCWM